MNRKRNNLWGIPAVLLAAVIFTSCATTEGGGEGISLAEAVKQSAEKIAADLPVGSRVAIAAWESDSEGLSDYIMEALTRALVDRGMEVADLQNLAYVYRELNLQMSGEVNNKSARSIGKFLGADLVVSGQLMELGGPPYRYRVSAVNVENATQGSVTRFDVRRDAALWRMIAALAARKPAVKSASYGGSDKPAPQTAGTFLDRGITFASRGEFESAIADYTEAIRLAPNLATAYLNRANAYYDQGDYDRSAADYTEAIRLDPHNAAGYANRANAYYHKEDYDRAIADYTQAIRLDPNYAAAYHNRGNVYDEQGDYDRAIADYTEAIRLDPNYAAAYHNRGNIYYDKEDYDRAIADYTEAIRLDPNYTAAYHNRGNIYYDKEDYDRAIADYTQVIRLAPNDAATYTNRGSAYYYKGNRSRARADWNKALQLDPNNATARDYLEHF
ncbi:MAG: tetratricopeptide repeat protein [Treponema sp.]|jgi:tetratricopeptide (TPR) repeat protein|nr:tetratricopeptide repeat protein [Treponema sp.]